MLYISFCPKLRLYSITTLLVAVCTIMFGFTISQGISKGKAAPFLQNEFGVIETYGGLDRQKLEDGQFYRLITPIFLHWNFLHLFFNMLAMLCFVSLAEKAYTPPIMVALFLICGAGGNLLSVNQNSPYTVSAGASTSLLGIIGTWIAFLILNWRGLKQMLGEHMQSQLLCFAMINIMFMMIFCLGSRNAAGKNDNLTDNWGHLGGFITGAVSGLWLIKPLFQNKYEHVCKMVGIGLTLAYFIINIILFYQVTPE